ncbi:threonine synthase [Lentimicrobium sp. L6]|uniref:threonine synthase n=1 Tax=Lentimicrobium sp. L6 TaxID=2735916 RepID=UPI0015575788|nr:threonine synthase [Lentimicrobium sp. L6]NPD84587.1 threonine synthase [Lentimicrobium sp. L6]
MVNSKFHYQCTDCGKTHKESETKYLCPICSKDAPTDQPPKGVLKAIYNYKKMQDKGVDFKTLKQNQFLDLLPIQNLESLPNLRVGQTPLYCIKKFENEILNFRLFLKDDSQNPTYSFKDRASAVVSAYAKEQGFETIVAASTGNAGSSLAGICAAQNQKAIIMVPEAAPIAKLSQILMYGAQIVPVKGTYDDAFDFSIKATEEFGWYNRNTAFNPLTIEGKKTVSYELFEQMGEEIPDFIFVPVGDGVIISGVYKGFEDLLKLGIINKLPTIIAVQAENSDNLVRNIGCKTFHVEESHTVADSISVDIPRNFNMAQQFIQNYIGKWLTVSDQEILKASSILSKETGLFAEPAASAAFAGFEKWKSQNLIPKDSSVIVLLTGSGLKDLKAISQIINMPKSIKPSLDELKNLMS